MSKPCNLCPRNCGIGRAAHAGFCGAGDTPYVARYMLHQWEEPCISGTRGTGAIFFCGCNMGCVFCQNHEINHTLCGTPYDEAALASLMLHLQAQGAHSIDLVTPTPHIDTIVPALKTARARGLSIPVVYNTNAYEKPELLSRLEGLVDIYLPDLKYITPSIAKQYSNCEDYFSYASASLKQMYEQAGELKLTKDGLAARGVLIRHLVLPGAVGETRRILSYLAEHYPLTTHISLMGQYVPDHLAKEYPPLDRRLLRREYDRAVEYCLSLGFSNVYIQDLSSADARYTPLFVQNKEEL